MINSIRMKLFASHVLHVALIIVCAFIGMSLFSEEIYKQKTLQLLSSEALDIEGLIEAEAGEEVFLSIDESAFRIGGSVFMYDANGDLLYNSYQMVAGGGYGMGKGKNNMLGNSIVREHVPVYEALETHSTASGKSVLVYNHALKSGGYLSIQMAEEKIGDALWVFEQLLIYVSIIALVVSLLTSLLLSRHFSRPIVELKNLAKDISKLNFEGRYTENRSDEIGRLGQHLNVLSHELKRKIDQLELELQKEKTMDSMRTQFVAQASHELQTPLTVLRNYIEVIEDGMVEPDEMQEHLSVMLEEIDDMSELVTGLLDLNQLRSGQFKINFERFNVADLLRLEVNRLKESLKRPDIVLEIALDQEVAWVYGDAKRIKQAVRNLVENAFKHADHRVRVSSMRLDNFYRVTIENSGKKIPEDDLETLWEVFYKGNDNYVKGTGLGLAIVKEIIEGHRGTYGIENIKDGVKSYFELKLDK